MGHPLGAAVEVFLRDSELFNKEEHYVVSRKCFQLVRFSSTIHSQGSKSYCEDGDHCKLP